MRYKGSFLGFSWNFLIPLFQLLVFWILFGAILGMGTTGDYPFAVFLFTGLLPWNFFANSITGGTASITSSSNLVKKIYFPLQILPQSKVLAELVAFLLSLIVLAVVLVVFGVGFSWHVVFLPMTILVELILISGLVYMCACGNVFYRDVTHIVGIIVMALFYLTPVLYSLEAVASSSSWATTLVKLNPMTGIITTYQNVLLEHRMPDWFWFGYSTVAALVLFVIGFGVFNRYKFRFEEEV
jgi:ABC-2 type transport system permease protein